MKLIIAVLIILIFGCGHAKKDPDAIPGNKQAATVYKIVLRTPNPDPMGDGDSLVIPGDIDELVVSSLNEPLKALAAFYSSIGGTNCSGDHCDLTTALGLGKQGSEDHKNLIKKYFPANDKIAETVLLQDCYLRPSGASSFSDYEYLTLIDMGDTVKVNYNLWVDSHGEISFTSDIDTYLFKDGKFLKIKRNIWTEVDK
jgi:hypothetical protein